MALGHDESRTKVTPMTIEHKRSNGLQLGGVIFSRFSSARLPGKALLDIGGRPLLGHIYLAAAKHFEKLVVATSEDKSDDVIAQFCHDNNIDCFRGSLNDVAHRFKEALSYLNVDFGFRICGDNLFFNQESTLEIQERIYKYGKTYDFLTNVAAKGRSYPAGMSVEAVNNAVFQRVYDSFVTLEDKEHVTKFFYDNHRIFRTFTAINPRGNNAAGISLSIDTKSDLEIARSMVAKMDREICDHSYDEVISIYNTVLRC